MRSLHPPRSFAPVARAARAALTGVAALAAALVGTTLSTCVGDDGVLEQDASCAIVLSCYFAAAPQDLSAVPGFAGLFPAEDPGLVEATYGPDGSCWRGGPVVAASCADRCKGLLWQDCARSYRRTCANGEACLADEECGAAAPCAAALDDDDRELPFCPQACEPQHALGCRFEDYADGNDDPQIVERTPDAPLFTACPDGTTCNADALPFAGPDTKPQGTSTGCCEIPSRDLLVGDQDACAPGAAAEAGASE